MAPTHVELPIWQDLLLILQSFLSRVNIRDDTGNIFIAEPPEIVPFTFGEAPINQGETAVIMCNLKKGDKPVTITWSLKGDIVSSDPTLTTSMIGNQISLLTITNVDYHHSGTYTCRATNKAGSITHSSKLLVNGEFMVHWKYLTCTRLRSLPFLFIALGSKHKQLTT